MGLPSFISVDIEPTNRCNAKCYFCPRDQTPHQGLMSTEVFEQSLARAVELRDAARAELDMDVVVNLCGLGEALLNSQTPSFIRKTREAGFEGSLASNGALLNEKRGNALLEAGLQRIAINVGEEGDDYEEIYKLPFERTHDNVVRFAEMAGDRCRVEVVLVDHRGDPEHQQRMMDYWRERGIEHFVLFGLINRAGALFVDHMQFENLPEITRARTIFAEQAVAPTCPAPFLLPFIGYDGKYYLCCSDWKKEVPVGDVFERSLLEILRPKLEHVTSREPICRNCNHDPLNRLTDELRANDAGQPAVREPYDLVAELVDDTLTVSEQLERLQPGVTQIERDGDHRKRRLIPVSPA